MWMKKNVLIALAVVLLMCIAAYAALFVAPTESKMGPIQRIFYLHAPAGMVSLLCFFVCFVGNFAYTLKRESKWDWLGVSAAEVGVAFCTVNIITGPIWRIPFGASGGRGTGDSRSPLCSGCCISRICCCERWSKTRTGVLWPARSTVFLRFWTSRWSTDRFDGGARSTRSR